MIEQPKSENSMTTVSEKFKLNAWYQATRPRTLVASFVPIGLAGAIAIQDGVFNLFIFLLALLGTVLLQTAANLVNEYADYVRGADELKQAGQGMAIKNKILSPVSIRNGAIASVVVGSLLGLFLLAQSGPLLWFIGIGGVLVAITYTAGPFPLAYNGLGEVASGIFMGPMIVLGAYYVMEPNIDHAKMIALMIQSLPITLMVAAILHANNIRDMDADRAVNKRTLAVMFGRKFANREYMFLIIGTYVLQVTLILFGMMPITTLLTLITVPEARRLMHIFNTTDDVQLMHQAQGRTAKLYGRYGILMVAGWLVFLLFQAIN